MKMEHTATEVADGVFAYVHPTGGWGWSNAGLVVANAESVLIDTLYDRPLTENMLSTFAPMLSTSPISTLINTHANGDHCFGNSVVALPHVEVIATAASAEEFDDLPPAAMAMLVEAARGQDSELGRYIVDSFGSFDFTGEQPATPTTTFQGILEREVGGRSFKLSEFGPAHTKGDLVVHLAEEGVVFTGDLLFIGGTPILWEGPVENWLRACEQIERWNPQVIVPGHGPLTDVQGVRAVARYLRAVQSGCKERHSSGMTVLEATTDLDRFFDGTEFGEWGDRERIAICVETCWRHLDPSHEKVSIMELFGTMATLAARYTR